MQLSLSSSVAPRRTSLVLCLLLAFSAAPAHAAAAGCQPLQQGRQANVPNQQPSFAGQTRACPVQQKSPQLNVTVLAKGLAHPWAVEPLPGGDLLVTERPGRLRIVTADGKTGEPIEGLPKIDAGGQGGLLDVALSPSFGTDRLIYWSYTEPRSGGNATTVARGKLSADRRRVEAPQVVVRAMPAYDGNKHFGSRLAFGPDGMLYVTLGERSDLAMRPQAQQMQSHMGKVLRVMPDGSVPSDNPFVGQKAAQPEIWSLGHRNVQAADFDSQGRLWVVEMGAQGGDELNLVERGKNYGWPVAAYGEEYSGRPIGDGNTAVEGTEQPVYYWDPVIAPSGAQWWRGDSVPQWRGSLFVGALKDRELVRLTFDANGRVDGEERLLSDRRQRVRDVKQGADGSLYVVTDENNGELWRVTPAIR